MNTKLLIDGDILVYRLGFAVQSKNGLEPFNNAAYLIKKTINDMCKKFGTDSVKIFLTADDKSNFRFKRATIIPYKGNRDKKTNPNAPDKPVYYERLRRYMVMKYRAEIVYGIEADDALGIFQMKHIDDPFFETVICSIDKDLNMIPGKHYNFVTGTLYEVKDPGILELSADRKKLKGTGLKWFYAQMLLGDSADNIPGIKGFGNVKVYNILADCDTEEDMWEVVQNTYIENFSDLEIGNVYDRLYEIADLLWMHRVEGDCKSDQLRLLGENLI